MIQMVGINKNIDIEIRERMSIKNSKIRQYTYDLLEHFKEVLIISTCNRTEIYFNGSNSIEKLKKIFEVLNWNDELREYSFYLEENETIGHIMEVSCGFHSKILGEDQILGQVKNAFETSIDIGSISGELQRLFQQAIACGKKFRTLGKFYEIPVSSASIAVNQSIDNGCKSIMIIGYGEVGRLAVKYALSRNIERLILVIRDRAKCSELEDSRVEKIDFKDIENGISNIDSVISCTAAPHIIIKESTVRNLEKDLIIFDLSVPRDVDYRLGEKEGITLYDIDDITDRDDINKRLRKMRMEEYRYVIEEYINDFNEWLKLREISPLIKSFVQEGKKAVEERNRTFTNKYKDEKQRKLVSKLIKSISDLYVNRAIEVLKEETLEGNKEECLRILKKIFDSN